ncbi:hypothetical protein ABTX81_30765 [Kitasatospora sp. NPDC097605]|uniref:hypothetical protein n=1 Tax=Kitasatospora sp. NPDC097605 TaxID=3157226 RepID=UPI00331DAFB6
MRITITVDDPTPAALELVRAFAALPAARVAAEPADRWTTERARTYFRLLPPRAQQILRQVVEGGGACSAETLRGEGGRSLRGCTGSFGARVREGAAAGYWAAGIPVPVESVTVGGTLVRLEMPGMGEDTDPLPVFRAALDRLDGER